MRNNWDGPIEVLHFGVEEPSTQIICSRYCAHFNPTGFDGSADLAAETALESKETVILPFHHTVVMRAGMLVLTSLKPLFETPAMPRERFSGRANLVFRQERGKPADPLIFADAAVFHEATRPQSAFLWCGGDSSSWTDAAWEEWSMIEAHMLERLATAVRIPQ
ncbi:MAG: hypothetical protein M3463_21240 [Verrucomicrobiota bacterium]|nr:hypothetical protein [Verrucomicrobiota bacterium]